VVLFSLFAVAKSGFRFFLCSVASKDKLKKRVVPFLASAGIEATVVRVSDSCLLVCEEFVGALASWLEKIAKQVLRPFFALRASSNSSKSICAYLGPSILLPCRRRVSSASQEKRKSGGTKSRKSFDRF
jgi:hypothetical protein